MSSRRRVLPLAACAISIAVPTAARADIFTAYGWVTSEANAIFRAGPGGLGAGCHQPGGAACTAANADVTFTGNTINFNTSANTIGSFLASGEANNIVYAPGINGSTALDPTIWEFAGTAPFTNGQSISIMHDDGVTLLVNGTAVISAPTATGTLMTTGTYTGPTGVFPFELFYAECCGAPAVLSSNIPAAVPEPASALLVATLLVGTGLVSRKRRKG